MCSKEVAIGALVGGHASGTEAAAGLEGLSRRLVILCWGSSCSWLLPATRQHFHPCTGAVGAGTDGISAGVEEACLVHGGSIAYTYIYIYI